MEPIKLSEINLLLAFGQAANATKGMDEMEVTEGPADSQGPVQEDDSTPVLKVKVKDVGSRNWVLRRPDVAPQMFGKVKVPFIQLSFKTSQCSMATREGSDSIYSHNDIAYEVGWVDALAIYKYTCRGRWTHRGKRRH